jgi:hypothetical protein
MMPVSSVLYLFTSACLAHEYSKYSIFYKSLRVMSPHGNERSTHWLHLPYVDSGLLLVASAVLYWPFPESIFFVGVEVYTGASFESWFGLAYSIHPIVLDIVRGSVMLFVLVGIDVCKLQGKIPLANSNSFAISAACHPPEEGKNAPIKGMVWGEVDTRSDSDVGNCSFNSMYVTSPLEVSPAR